MTDDINRYFARFEKKMEKALRHDAPRIAAKEAVILFKQNFRDEGFFGRRWKEVQRRRVIEARYRTKKGKLRTKYRVWAKDDPFWDKNQPGNLWNCKCDWEETDDPVTEGNPTAPVRHDGLEGNPAKTGQIFTDNASYIRKAGKITLDKETAQSLPNLQKLLDADTRRWRIDYYTDTGGTLYTSKARIDEGKLNKQEKAKFDKEHAMCRTLADNGHRVDYRESVEGSFDIFMNGTPADLKKLSTHNNIARHAKHAINKQGAEIVVFEFEEINAHIMEELKKLDKMKIPYVYFVSTDKSTVIKSTTR